LARDQLGRLKAGENLDAILGLKASNELAVDRILK